MLNIFGLQVKPDSGFWKGASYDFTFTIPALYPHDPPKVRAKFSFWKVVMTVFLRLTEEIYWKLTVQNSLKSIQDATVLNHVPTVDCAMVLHALAHVFALYRR